ncbi:hypothetical protein [Mucilaginibacter celer]|nr:hypothetical protein [Mucilaginibacter celer]
MIPTRRDDPENTPDMFTLCHADKWMEMEREREARQMQFGELYL